jgi:hypothetical protein
MSSQTDPRERRTAAAELKFLVAADAGERVRAWSRARLAPDPHGGGEFGDEYRTSTIYFDTPALDVFRRQGSYGRGKYRARRYGCRGAAFLERKVSRPGLVIKRRTLVPDAALGRALDAAGSGEWEGEWFRRRLRARCLRPVCQIAYQRTARVDGRRPAAMRLTLDRDVRALAVDRLQFSCEPGTPVLDDQLVLELKYAGAMPDLFRELLDTFGLVPRSASKYRLGVAALGLDVRPEN